MNDPACAARPVAIVEREFMDRNRPRSEQDWWAINEIDRLRETLIEVLHHFAYDDECELTRDEFESIYERATRVAAGNI